MELIAKIFEGGKGFVFLLTLLLALIPSFFTIAEIPRCQICSLPPLEFLIQSKFKFPNRY